MAVIPASQEQGGPNNPPSATNYPFSDPIFQLFNVQQILVASGVSTGQLYDAPAPELPAEDKPKAGK